MEDWWGGGAEGGILFVGFDQVQVRSAGFSFLYYLLLLAAVVICVRIYPTVCVFLSFIYS